MKEDGMPLKGRFVVMNVRANSTDRHWFSCRVRFIGEKFRTTEKTIVVRRSEYNYLLKKFGVKP